MSFPARKQAKKIKYTSLLTLRDSWMSGLSMHVFVLVIVIVEVTHPMIRIDGNILEFRNFHYFTKLKKG